MSVARPPMQPTQPPWATTSFGFMGPRSRGPLTANRCVELRIFRRFVFRRPRLLGIGGVLHFEDGSLSMDWFVPHLAPTITARTPRPWKKRDIQHISLSQGGLFHDAKHQRTERFARAGAWRKSLQLNENPNTENIPAHRFPNLRFTCGTGGQASNCRCRPLTVSPLAL